MDPSAFVAPARIGVLLVPLHPIKRARFQQYADQIKAFDSIELSQVPVDNRGERAIFSSSPTTTGQLLFEYLTPTTYASAHPLAFLAEFQLHRQVHGIIGIFDASEHTDDSTSLHHALAQFHHALRRLPKTFAVKLFGFHPSEHQLTEAQKHINENDGLVLIPATTQISFFLGTVLADFAGHILREFSNLVSIRHDPWAPLSNKTDLESCMMQAAQLESRTSIPTPQETPQLTSPFTFIPTKPNARSTIHSYTAGATRPTATRSSSLPPNTTPHNSTSTSTNASASSSHLNNSAGAAKGGGIISNEAPKIDLTAFGLAAPPQSRTSLGLWGGSSSGNQEGFLYGRSIQSHVNVAPNAAPSPPPGSTLVGSKSRKKVAGRERKLMADMWLLAGRTEQAIACYEEAIALLKLTWSDNVWYASALEGLTIALVLQAWRPPSPAAAVTAAATAKHASTNSISKSTNSMSKKTANGTSTPTSTVLSNAADPSTFLSSIPDRLGQAVGLYEKMLPNLALANSLETPPPPDPDRCHPLIYAEACLRIARFLLAVHEERGKIDRAIEKLIIPSNCSALSALRKSSTFMTSTSAARTKNSEDEAQEARWRSLSPSNPVPRSMIAQWASMAYSAHLGQLALPTRLRVTGEIASFFGRIGYRRKEGFVLRELAALCGQGVAGKGVEVFSAVHNPSPTSPVSATKDGPKVSGGQLLPAMNDRTASIVRTTSDSAGNESIIRIAEKVCESFGIVVVPRIAKDTTTANTALGHHSRQKSLLQGRPLELDYRLSSSSSPFGWSHLQMGVLKDAISVAEALPDYQAAIRFTVTALRAFAETMPAGDQLELSRNIPRIFAAAMRRGAAFELEYWGPTQLVMSLEMAPLTPNRLPIEHSIKDAEANGTFNNFALAKKDPFIIGGQRSSLNASHDPNDASSRIHPTLITNEVAEVFVTLQNPFGFDLEIQSMQLSTTGVDFICDALSTIVPAGSFHTVRLSGTPQAPGRLTIRGCHILLAGCTSREFLLPVWNDQEEEKRQKVALLDTARERIKTTGLTAFVTNRQASQRAAEQSTTTTTEQEFRFLECTVVREMPLLCVSSTSLTHGALMLYDGETSTIRIALENVSTRPVQFIKLTFSDLHTTTTQAYVDENELPPAEAYEIEADNRDRPVFSWAVDQVPRIEPGQTYLLDVQCLGKVGCGSGTIQIDYATLPPLEAMADPKTVFHTRQILCDVFMTVHRALLAHTLDILRLQALPEHVAFAHGRSASVAHLGRRGAALDQRLEQSLRDVDDGEHCLVSIDVMNAYGKPFEVKIERCEDESGFFQVRQRLEPGATLRMLARIDRINIPAEEADRPIPALSERQFVLSKHQVSAAEQRSTRELFWFREELLRRIRATWNEVGSLRTGTISLRSLKLSSSLLDVLKGDEVEVELQLVKNEASSPEAFHFKGRGNRLVYAAQPNEFIDVCAYVSNHSPLAVQLALRLDLKPPDATVASSLTHLARHIIIEGVSPVAVRTLLPGESETVKVSICLLAEGRYELGCVVEDVREGAEADKAWSAREPLIVDVA